MIDFDEELKKFSPSIELEDAQDRIYQRDLTDVMDIVREMLKDYQKTVKSQ